MFKLRAAVVAKVFAILCAGLVTACAPPPKSSKAVDRTAALRAAGLAASNDDANWRCPYEANVTLKDYIGNGGWDYTGTGDYKVCVSRSSTSTFKVSGTAGSQAICVYPMRVSYTGTPQLVETPKCFGINGSAIEVSFQAKDINYMVIVDANYTDAMSSCLGGPSPCPSHSEGFVQ
jgi:hypothetical protein